MRVSILIPSLNRRRFLEECLQTARSQSHRDLEIVVSDDGSNDGTRELVRRVAGEDERVRLLTDNPRPGIFTNMNYLVSRATGDAFCLLGDDDRLAPAYVEELVRPLRSDTSVIASFCDHWVIDTVGKRYHAGSEESSRRWGRSELAPGVVEDPIGMALEQSMCLGFAMYRASVFQREALDLSSGGAADWDYAFRAAQLGKIFYVKQRLADYRVHPGTATSRRVYGALGPIQILRSRRFERPVHEQRRRELLRAYLRQHAFLVASDAGWGGIRAVGEYLKLGGSLLDLKLSAAVMLSLMPRPLARRVRSLIVR